MALLEKKHPRVGVGVVVMKDGKILLGKRIKTHGDGKWSAPGGWLEFQESFADAAMRECREETGVEIQNTTFFYATNNRMPEEDMHTITIWMKAEYIRGEPTTIETNKFVEVGWYDPANLPRPLFTPLALLIEEGIPFV